MIDKIETVGNSTIHHGEQNNRIYLMKLKPDDHPGILEYMDNLSQNNGYEKIIAKVPQALKEDFLNHGYEYEASIENFYKGEESVYFLAKYFSEKRKMFDEKNEILATTQFCMEKRSESKIRLLDDKFEVKKLSKKHIPDMVKIYEKIFESYPFEIFNPDYIAETMATNIDYYGVFDADKIVALSSSEMDLENLNTEMTDFAALPDYRGQNFSIHLLKKMEEDAREKGLKTAYTIARAKSTGMNMTFAKMGYEFGGTLVKNTNICGLIETMNVWYKSLN